MRFGTLKGAWSLERSMEHLKQAKNLAGARESGMKALREQEKTERNMNEKSIAVS
jgi:hypothetical protein